MPELAKALKIAHNVPATPAMLSRHLIHRLGFTFEKVPDRDGAPPPAGSRGTTRVATPPDAEDAS